MSILLKLISINLRNTYRISEFKHMFRKDWKKLAEVLAVSAGILLGGGMLMFFYVMILLSIYTQAKMLGQSEAVLTASVLSTQFMVLLLGIFHIIGSFYFSKDMNILVPLPLKPYQVLGSKFAVVLLGEYLITVLLFAPALFIYGIDAGSGFQYIIKALLVTLAVPAIPLAISAIFVVILMRYVNIQKKKDMLAIVGGFAALAAVVAVNFLTQRIPDANQQEFLNRVLSGQIKFVTLIGSKFPPSIWATYALSRQGTAGLPYLALFLGVAVLLALMLMWIGNNLFYKGILSGQEVSKRRKASISQPAGFKAGSPAMALFKREWKLFLRTPVYVLNGLGGMVIAPFLLLMPVVSKNQQLDMLLAMARDEANAATVSLVSLGIMVLTTSINIIGSTALSREGSSFWMSKLIPVAPAEQVMSKVMHSVAVTSIGLVIAGAAVFYITGMALARLLIVFLLSLVITVLIVACGLLIDVLRPKLDWTSPQEAVKQNINGMLGMLAAIMVMAVLGAAAVFLIKLGAPEWVIYLIIGAVSAGAAAFFIKLLKAEAGRKYARLEA